MMPPFLCDLLHFFNVSRYHLLIVANFIGFTQLKTKETLVSEFTNVSVNTFFLLKLF